MNSRDSFLITKSRLEAKHRKTRQPVTPPGGTIKWNRFTGLDPIADASPPSASLLEAWKSRQKIEEVGLNGVEAMEIYQRPEEQLPGKRKHKSVDVALHEHHTDQHDKGKGKRKTAGASRKKVEVVETPQEVTNEHEDCPICEVYRPRWFETEHREW